MAGPLKWTALVGAVTFQNGVTVNSGTTHVHGTEYDNSDANNRHRWAVFELQFQHGTAPAANEEWTLHFILSADGTNFEDTAEPDSGSFSAAFEAAALSTAQRRIRWRVGIPPTKFRCMLRNDTNQNSSTNSVILKMWPYNENLP